MIAGCGQGRYITIIIIIIIIGIRLYLGAGAKAEGQSCPGISLLLLEQVLRRLPALGGVRHVPQLLKMAHPQGRPLLLVSPRPDPAQRERDIYINISWT